MKKLHLSAGIFVCLSLTALSGLGQRGVLAQEGQQTLPVDQGPTVVAPGGLQAREIQSLQKQYSYDVRRKGLILEPAVSTPFAEEPSITEITGGYMTEEDKLHRYFGIATVLYELGNLEEAIEIVEYILDKKPKDEYARNYLKKLQTELRSKKAEWGKTDKKDAKLLRETKIKQLEKEGVDFFKQKRYDNALMSFNDILALDPNNGTARNYMEKLKKYYSKEARLEDMLRKSEQYRRSENGETTKIEAAATGLLDEFEDKNIYKTGEGLLNRFDAGQLAVDREAESLLDSVEKDAKIKEIISQRKEEEKRARSFILGEGDILTISVRDHPELSGTTMIRPEGAIILPLINEAVMVAGLTVSEIRDKITASLERYVQDPVLYVGIEKFSSKIFYVIDESGATPYNITRSDFTLRDALFLSDWGSNRALGRVLVVRPDKLHPIVTKVDAFDLIYRGNLAKNIRIQNGDVIYVPQTAAGKITETVRDSLSPIKQIKDLRNEWLNDRWNQEGWGQLFNIPKDLTSEAESAAPAPGS